MNTTPDTPDNHGTRSCVQCGKALVQVGTFWVCPRHGQIPDPRSFTALRIFVSYGHDANEELVRRIKADLEQRGHDVWFDKTDIKAGDDWRRAITDGILHSQRVVAFLSKHSTRDPGVCRDEIAIAIGVKGGNIQTILVESETEVRPPVNIGHIQWLDMHEWKERRAGDEAAWEDWYQAKLAEIIRLVESDESRRFAGEIETLNRHLKPIRSDARIYDLLKKGFFGRQWLFDAVEQWRTAVKAPLSGTGEPCGTHRLFWITGDPGVGKSTFAAQLMHTRSDTVIAALFVEWDKPDHRDARRVVRSLAFQLATRLPDYRKLLLTLSEITELDRKDPAELFDYLLANPFRSVINGGRERQLIVIDALDEAAEGGRNPLVELLARHASRLPEWLGLVVTSRPESAVQTPLQGLNPFVLDARTEVNRIDLRHYLRRQLAPQLHGRPDSAALVEQILQKSEGVFLYVERFCDAAQQNHLSLDRPEGFPQGLGGIFAQWFQRQFPDLENFRHDVRPAMRAILAAREPLPVEVLQRLFHWQDEELRDFTRTLGSLFPVAKESDGELIKPYHRSLVDWLTDHGKAGSFFVSIKEGHRTLAAEFLKEYRAAKASHYCLRNLPYHLVRAGRIERAQSLLDETKWIRTKRRTLGVEAVLSDIDLIRQSAAEQEDWACVLGAAVAGALTIQGAFQVPARELIPIYARAGLGEHAVEMAQYVEGEDSRAYLLLDIANAAEAGNPQLARQIRSQLWRSYVLRVNTPGASIDKNYWYVIVGLLAYADPVELVLVLRECDADLHRKIIDCLLEREHTVHRLVDLPESDIAFVCARIASHFGDLNQYEQLLIAGLDPDVSHAETLVNLPDARMVLEARKAAEFGELARTQAISYAMAHISIHPQSYVQLIIRALLKINAHEAIAGVQQRTEMTERIDLLVETSLCLVRASRFDDALAVMLEGIRLEESQPELERLPRADSSEVDWVTERAIRGIAKLDPERALTLASESGLQTLTRTNLRLVVLWELPNYEEVKKFAHSIDMPEWLYATKLRAVHDLAGAYQTWKKGHQKDTDELKAMLSNAQPKEGPLILRLLREELFPRLWPARLPADTTALHVQIASAVASVDPDAAKPLLQKIGFDVRGGEGYASRCDLVALLPPLALAGDSERALALSEFLDKDNIGFGAIAVAEIHRLVEARSIHSRKKKHPSHWGELIWALRNLEGHGFSQRDVETILSKPWAWVNARVAASIGWQNRSKWSTSITFGVIAGKATNIWPELRASMDQHLTKPGEQELALCEASQWMPLTEAGVLDGIKNTALATIAWARMARRTDSPTERKSWMERAEKAADQWPSAEYGEALNILWIFIEEMGASKPVSRRLAGRILDECTAKNMYWTAPALLTASLPGVFDAGQQGRVMTLAKAWQDWLHTFKFVQSSIRLDDGNLLAAEHLVRLAGAWWKTDSTCARECAHLALDHAKDANAKSTRWKRLDVQREVLRCWATRGDRDDWKQAMACWRWGPAFLDGAASFVERWSALQEAQYGLAQAKQIQWAQAVSRNVLNAI